MVVTNSSQRTPLKGVRKHASNFDVNLPSNGLIKKFSMGMGTGAADQQSDQVGSGLHIANIGLSNQASFMNSNDKSNQSWVGAARSPKATVAAAADQNSNEKCVIPIIGGAGECSPQSDFLIVPSQGFTPKPRQRRRSSGSKSPARSPNDRSNPYAFQRKYNGSCAPVGDDQPGKELSVDALNKVIRAKGNVFDKAADNSANDDQGEEDQIIESPQFRLQSSQKQMPTSHDMEFEQRKESGGPHIKSNQSVFIPTAPLEKQESIGNAKDEKFCGLTGVRTGSDFMTSSSCTGSSADFEADTNQTLHSYANQNQQQARPPNQNSGVTIRSKLTMRDKSFAKTITEEIDQYDEENKKPNLLPVDELEEEKYDMVKAQRKQQEVRFMTDFLDKDITFTLKDTETSQEQCNQRIQESGSKLNQVENDLKAHGDLLNKKLDGMMAKIIKEFDFDAYQPDAEAEATSGNQQQK